MAAKIDAPDYIGEQDFEYEYDFTGDIESNNEYNYFRLFFVMKS